MRMRMRTYFMKFRLFLALLIFTSIGNAQNQYYCKPLPINLKLEKGFADIQEEQFHTGYDVSTLGATGVAVYAIADGFVSRIVVSATGNGTSLFIEHDNGTTSVYSHLSKLRPDIDIFVKNAQYKFNSFEIDLAPSKEQFKVEKGKSIALSGMTGNADHPHLHLEIRNTKTGDAINPAVLGLTIPDKTPPKFLALQIAPLSENSHVNYDNQKIIYEVDFFDDKYVIKGNQVIPVYGKIGFAFESEDFADGISTRFGIASMQLIIDGEIRSVYNCNRISLNDNSGIYGLIDYELYKESGRKFQRTWKVECNALKNFEFDEEEGIIDIEMNKKYPVQIEIKDVYGNSSTLEFTIEGKYREVKSKVAAGIKKLSCNSINTFAKDALTLEMQPGTLFEDIDFTYKFEPIKSGCYSALYHIHGNNIALFKKARISIQPGNLPEKYHSKVLLAKVDSETGKTTPAGGSFDNGVVKEDISEFGIYTVTADTISPKIEPIDFENNQKLQGKDEISFKITDDFSGITKYEGMLDDKWALFEYDKKNDIIKHVFDSVRFVFGKKHQLKLTVTDQKGNSAVYEATFEK